MNLRKLFKSIDTIYLPSNANLIEIEGIAFDSRQVKENHIFFAINGMSIDGAKFIDKAIANGAKVILCENDSEFKPQKNIIYLKSDNTKLVLSKVCANFFEHQPEKICAVTGTNGKTSIVHFCRQLWEMLGENSASIGTTGIDLSGDDIYKISGPAMTSFDQVRFHQILSDLYERNYKYLAIESSSHGLDQHRIDGATIYAAAFTNLTQDHLDYHETFENYFNAKMRLFKEVMPKGSVAVINSDDEYSAKVIKIAKDAKHKIIDIGFKADALKFNEINESAKGQILRLTYNNEEFKLNINLSGKFQIYNLITAVALVASSGFNIVDVLKLTEKINPVAGRMQKVEIKGVNLHCFVDYAHTPDALEKALKSLKQIDAGNLWVIFGCGGNRDAKKRPLMGKIANEIADFVVVTDDNPRNEDPAKIREEILNGCDDSVLSMENRADAIKYVVSNAKDNDIILLAGKGHEKTQIIGSQTIKFDDTEELINELKKCKG